MKNLFLAFALLISTVCVAQDFTQIVVNVRDNARLQFNGSAVKMKAVVIDFSPVTQTTKEFCIKLSIQMYENIGGSYGQPIISVINADATLSAEEKADLLERYADKIIFYSTANRWVNVSGDNVHLTTPGAIPEIQYWQTFKLNQVAGMGSISTQGALDAQYLTIRAIILKLNSRKNF